MKDLVSGRSARRRALGVADRVQTISHGARDALPSPEASMDAVYARMLLCMALCTKQIRAAAVPDPWTGQSWYAPCGTPVHAHHCTVSRVL